MSTLSTQQPLFDLLNLTLEAKEDPVPPALLSFLSNLSQAPAKDQKGTSEQSEGSMQAKQATNQATTIKVSAGHSDLTEIVDAAETSTSAVVEDTSIPAAYEQLKKQYDAIDQCYQFPSRILRNSSLSFKQQPISRQFIFSLIQDPCFSRSSLSCF